jgi:hypothetical protein
MKAIMPKSWRFLPESDKKMIEQVKEKEIDRRMMAMLDIVIKMTCDVLNETENLGESRLLRYIGNLHHVFNKHFCLVKEGKQIEYLDSRMRKIFRKGGYPDEFFKNMFDDRNINTGSMDCKEKSFCKTDFRTFLNEVSKYDSIIKNERKTIEYMTINNLPGKDKLIEECESRIFAMKQAKTDFMEAISKVSDPVARAVYTARYVRGDKWEAVAQSVSGMSERNARLIHDKWLSELEENLKGLKKEKGVSNCGN